MKRKTVKRFIAKLLSVLFILMEVAGWFFNYALLTYFATDGAMCCGKWGLLGMLAAACLSSLALFYVILKWG